jgi:hypothetical protein
LGQDDDDDVIIVLLCQQQHGLSRPKNPKLLGRSPVFFGESIIIILEAPFLEQGPHRRACFLLLASL